MYFKGAELRRNQQLRDALTHARTHVYTYYRYFVQQRAAIGTRTHQHTLIHITLTHELICVCVCVSV